MDWGALWATVHRVTSWTQLKWLSARAHTHTHTHTHVAIILQWCPPVLAIQHRGAFKSKICKSSGISLHPESPELRIQLHRSAHIRHSLSFTLTQPVPAAMAPLKWTPYSSSRSGTWLLWSCIHKHSNEKMFGGLLPGRGAFYSGSWRVNKIIWHFSLTNKAFR